MSAIATLLSSVIEDVRARHPDRPALIGVGGAQGSGKSYQCRQFAAAHADVAHFSLDDVYLTRAERRDRAILSSAVSELGGESGFEPQRRERPELRPLFETRGVPGTHDLSLARRVIKRLGGPNRTRLPCFDKLTDDRAPTKFWSMFVGPARAILVDGWCMAAEIISPLRPRAALNAVEEEDMEWIWRHSQSFALLDYAKFFESFDNLIYLKAPDWKTVCRWRLEQEEELRGASLTALEQVEMQRFMMHFERITRAMMLGSHYARWIVHLDERRNVVRVEER